MKKYLTIILVISSLNRAAAQTMDLPAILDRIASAHPSMKMYDASIQSLDALAGGAHNWDPPSFSSGFWMTPYQVSLWRASGSGTKGMGSYMISGEQLFPNKQYNDAEAAYLRTVSSVEKEKKAASLNDLVADAKKNYYDWVVAQKKLVVLQENESLLGFMITNAETRYQNGLGKISAYYKAKASLGKLEDQQLELQNQITQNRIALNTLMNRDGLDQLVIDTSDLVKDFATEPADSATLYNNRSDLKAIDQSIQLAGLQQQVERADLQPRFGIQYANMFGFGGSPLQFSLMGMVKIPINWSSRRNKAAIESLQWKKLSLTEEKHSLANTYSGMAFQAEQTIQARKKQLKIYEQTILPALKKNYQSTQLAYQQNTAELFELYDAWETLNSTELEYLDLQQDLYDQEIRLENILEIK